MGTNYYARINTCECCGRYEQVHIGKSGCMVQAFSEDDDSPVGVVRSFNDWRKLFLEHSVIDAVFDEYGGELTPQQLVERFESSSMEARRRQFDWMVNHPTYYSPDRDWLDDEGFSVTRGEWS